MLGSFPLAEFARCSQVWLCSLEKAVGRFFLLSARVEVWAVDSEGWKLKEEFTEICLRLVGHGKFSYP